MPMPARPHAVSTRAGMVAPRLAEQPGGPEGQAGRQDDQRAEAEVGDEQLDEQPDAEDEQQDGEPGEPRPVGDQPDDHE